MKANRTGGLADFDQRHFTFPRTSGLPLGYFPKRRLRSPLVPLLVATALCGALTVIVAWWV